MGVIDTYIAVFASKPIFASNRCGKGIDTKRTDHECAVENEGNSAPLMI